MRILTGAQMREADRITIEEIGIPSVVLMENAGRRVVEAIRHVFGPLTTRRVGVVCGRGNNAGDGLVVARLLAEDGVDVRVFVCADRRDYRGDAATNLSVAERLGVPLVWVAADPAQPGPDSAVPWTSARSDLLACDLLVDALLGTGLTRPVEGLFHDVVTDVNVSGRPVVSIDLPSGLSADRATPQGSSIQAELTVTLGALKPSLVLPPTSAWAGDVVVADIGIPERVIDGVAGERLELLTPEEMQHRIPVRPPDGHKGDFGHVVVVAGSEGKTGAAALAALGALRSGAGLVTVATPRRCVPVVASLAPEYMTVALPETDAGGVGDGSLEAVLKMGGDVVAVGPGLGTGRGARRLVDGLLRASRQPLVLDADALNVLADDPTRLRERRAPDVIVTPHPGEMARLTGSRTDEIQADRLSVARSFAVGHNVTVVLKGSRTLIASPDGTVALNPTGNVGMASGGMGDVLTGVVAAWRAQLGDAPTAAQLGVYLHGLAGDLAAATQGPEALMASDLAAHLGPAAAAAASGHLPAGDEGGDDADDNDQ